jgi:WD40 repeat protein
VIRLFDLSKLSESTKLAGGTTTASHDDVVHSIKCNSEVTGLCWRKTVLRDDGFGDLELISTHGSPGCEVKLWQINKYKQSESQFRKPLYINGKKVQYWFTKIEDWQVHGEEILDSILSPDSSTLASLSADETLRFWKMFETFEEVNRLKQQKRQRQGKRSQSEGH